MISQRIKKIVNEIEYGVIADIGCDHGLTPIHALEIGKIKRAIACDLNTGPINKVLQNIKVYGANEIQVRQGYGLDKIQPGEVEAVIISGMGGMLIMEILEKASYILCGISQLILQPQRDVHELRRFLHHLGYMIKNEVMLKEEDKFYNIINCHRGVDTAYSDTDYLLGKVLLERTDSVLYEYLKAEIVKLEKIKKNIHIGEYKDASAERLRHIEGLLEIYKNVVKN